MFNDRKLGLSAPQSAASVLALVLICVPLTIGAIWAFPIWDDAWLWLLLKENGAGTIAASVADRPVMAALWWLLAGSDDAFWWASFVAQALLWPLLGVISALLWIHTRCWICGAIGALPWKDRSIQRPLEPEDLRITDYRYGATLSLLMQVKHAAACAPFRSLLRSSEPK